MSGSNTICVATVLLETGMVEMQEPETVVRLEAPAGVVEVRCACRDGRVESVELTNVPGVRDAARRAARGARARDAHGRRRVRRHVVRDRRRGARSGSRSSRTRRASSARSARRSASRRASSSTADVSIVQLAGPWQGVGAVSRNAVVIAPGRLDRSATGTGLSARMAVLHARGLMGVGDTMSHASPIGSTFEGRIVAEAERGDRPRDPRQRVRHRARRAVRRRTRPVPRGLPPERHLAG